ncbi:MAG: type II toxin-antitoxin system HicB family antitoxin [Prosthecobacter sp.]|nr:type II toxin-antitoxin system HicB family antitoxin [Prosthecobacter sp.]
MKRKAQEFHVLVERDEDGWLIASVPQLPGCYTQAKSYDTLMKRTREAIKVWLDANGEALEKSEFIGVQRVMV